MCGIAGIISTGEKPNDDALDRMVEAITHRGPDDRGTCTQNGVALGIRRLSIIDVEGGHQPIANEDGTIHVVMNGELYSYPEARAALVAAGHDFRTHSDTEVLVHGYEEWGLEGLLARLNGMFAFALYDERKDSVYLVRDRLGIKPLVYTQRQGRLLFGSGLTALLASGMVVPEPDPAGVRLFLHNQFVPAPYTVLRGVRKLPPGSYLEIHKDRIGEPVRYWRLPGEIDTSRTDEQWVKELREILDDAVRIHMISDVEVGAFLSGGVDSSIIVGLMSNHTKASVKAFSIGFEDDEYDETKYAREAAKRFGVDFHHTQFTAEHILSVVGEALRTLEEPIADPAVLPTLLLSSEARKYVKVILTGEGADELFAGYGYYERLMSGWQRSKERLRHRVRAIGIGREGRNLAAAFRHRSRASAYPYVMTPSYVERLVRFEDGPGETARVIDTIERGYDTGDAEIDPLNRGLRVDTQGWLPDDLLMKVDRATMAHGLEARVPFLDYRVVELAMRMPAGVKIRNDVGKHVLRSAFGEFIGGTLAGRAKHGFNLPMGRWFRGELRSVIDAELTADPGVPWLERQTVAELAGAHQSGKGDFARPLWTLYVLVSWFREAARSGGAAAA